MNGLVQQVRMSLRLYFRNTMGLIYGYIFPTIFLIAFRVLYRSDRVPVIRHVGELLTVTVLGGACFGLPTTLVSERERGVWRRYRLAPISTGTLVTGAVAARYVILLTAGLLQLVLAMLIGMPLPGHPLALTVAFTLVSFAFLGLGLVIGMMADNVPAVQALGQCIFLPMLIIGGVAVPLDSLPTWAQHLSAFFPGRYAVQALQACTTGTGLGTVGFSLFGLLIIGLAAMVVGAKAFRWDAEQRFMAGHGKSWVALALVSWAAVGVLAEWRGEVTANEAPVTITRVAPQPQAPVAAATPPPVAEAPVPPSPAPVVQVQAPPPAPKSPPTKPSEAPPAPTRTTAPAAAHTTTAAATPPTAPASTAANAPTTSAEPALAAGPPTNGSACGVARWQDVTVADIDKQIVWSQLPSDSGVVTPIASAADQPDPDVSDQLAYISNALAAWPPANVADPIQRVRNVLFVPAAADVLEVPLESFLPGVVFTYLQSAVPKDTLIKQLFWVACNPDGGDATAIQQLRQLGFGSIPEDIEEVRNRAGAYGAKLLGRILGRSMPN